MRAGEPSTALMSRPRELFAPKIYYFHPLLAGPRQSWPVHLNRCRELGFSHVLLASRFAAGAEELLSLHHETPAIDFALAGDRVIEAFAGACQEQQLQLLIDIALRSLTDARLIRSRPGWFHTGGSVPARTERPSSHRHNDLALARFDDPIIAEDIAGWWIKRLTRLASCGVAGFRCEDPGAVAPNIWRHIIAGVKQRVPHCRFLAWTPGTDWAALCALRGVGFDAAFSSVAWWDGRASWLVEEHQLLRGVGCVIGCPTTLHDRWTDRDVQTAIGREELRHLLRRAVAIADGLLIPMGLEFGLKINFDHCDLSNLKIHLEDRQSIYATHVREAVELTDKLSPLGLGGEMRMLTGAGQPVSALLRCDAADARYANSSAVVLINADQHNEQPLSISLDPLPATVGIAAVADRVIAADRDCPAALGPGEVRVVSIRPTVPIKMPPADTHALNAAAAPRIAIENVVPNVEDGRFLAKRVIGEHITVAADVFTDGHEVLAVELLWRAVNEREWRRVDMKLVNNDRWHAAFLPDRIGRHEFTIEAWWDRYATFCRDLEVKYNTGSDVGVEIAEGRHLLERTWERSARSEGKLVASALSCLVDAPTEMAVEILLAQGLRQAMREADERLFPHRRQPPFPINVERPQAAFGAWYELFPRSATDDPTRHGTFSGVMRRLPAIRDMGFDVLYLTPIHPIGATNRKGRNNSLDVRPGDVGSPYAIGSSEGGHDAIHPALGTIDDFRRLREAAAHHGMELALDFAIQCSPDHPWLQDNPEWFKWRPDGTVRYAENPPKKYEDIVNIEFYGADSLSSLWKALLDVVLFWRNEGVSIFRVDNPHTKPLPFWEWLIAQVNARYPDVIFLSEAFTRPKMMYRLAKIGFSQSYTYFTWRNTKTELIEYFSELTTTTVKEFFRPHLFVNTPDINPYFLQTSGRPGFLIRAALGATLSGLWGMYSGFELCESMPLPGREEYLDSEKYEIRVRRFDALGNISAEIAKLNRIRKSTPALQSHLGLRFYPAHHDKVLLYGKWSLDRSDMILVAVNLDPFHPHEVMIEVPLWEWNLPDDESVQVRDLMRDVSFVWQGKMQRIFLDPTQLPFAIWRVAPAAGG
jgi:starch synthase (maltosyl-transferring)